MTREYTDIALCEDCMLYVANGDVPSEEDSPWTPEQFDNMWRGYDVTLGKLHEHTTGGDCEGCDDSLGFSWQSCDGCGSSLGGERYAATAWKGV